MTGPYVGSEVTRRDLVGIGPPGYTAEEERALLDARAIVQRAWEGGAFEHLLPRDGLANLRDLHHVAARAQTLLPEGVTIRAAATAVGDKLLLGIVGR